jgi:acetoacetyl-CoA reductase
LSPGGPGASGRAIVERLKADGMQVAGRLLRERRGRRGLRKELGVMVVKGNVGNFMDCKHAVEKVEKEFGPIDVLVNNAGITRDGVFHRMTSEQWSEVIRVNMDSLFNMTRQVIEGMREREWGRIINISSINGQKGQIGQTNYSAAKAGMIGFTKALALENAKKGVTVNCSRPRLTIDNRDGAGRAGEGAGSTSEPNPRWTAPAKGEEIADTVLVPRGERAAYVTGTPFAEWRQYLVG